MVKQLYALEDRLFYASRFCAPGRSQRFEQWSIRVGAFADFLGRWPLREARPGWAQIRIR